MLISLKRKKFVSTSYSIIIEKDERLAEFCTLLNIANVEGIYF
jgi:hypothetical protein